MDVTCMFKIQSSDVVKSRRSTGGDVVLEVFDIKGNHVLSFYAADEQAERIYELLGEELA